jgi:hypothetical protein
LINPIRRGRKSCAAGRFAVTVTVTKANPPCTVIVGGSEITLELLLESVKVNPAGGLD